MTALERTDAVAKAIRDHDNLVAAAGLRIWLGAEPTFTHRFSSAPEWSCNALGREKEARARRLISTLGAASPGSALLRTIGRKYPGEAARRWSYGLLRRRDGTAVWSGPPDPLLGGGAAADADVARLADCLVGGLAPLGWRGFRFVGNAPFEHRILFRTDGTEPANRKREDPRLLRPSVHSPGAEDDALTDHLALEGNQLLIVSLLEDEDQRYAVVELPFAGDADHFLALFALVERAATEAKLRGLVLRGFPPVADEKLCWSTVTPDPGVVEVNQAPADSVSRLLAENRTLFEAASAAGLAPYRLHYNGQMDDSGGGGQLSVGGPSPAASPFVLEPHLLPRLVRYLNHHPSLSYWFAPLYVGAYSQAPRPDEGIGDLFNELEVALEQISMRRAPDLEFLWRSLSPFLRDISGNAHRSELNIEKLWSPVPRADGIAGVVEFRAFRMAQTPESLAALAALVRSVIAMLTTQPFDQPLVHWGSQLHDRFSLPFFVEQDLDSVLEDLADTGFGLRPQLVSLLRTNPGRDIACLRCGAHSFSLVGALEFWQQVGDTLAQPTDSRMVDASTARIEVRIEGGDPEQLGGWQLAVNGYSVPLRLEHGHDGPVRLIGIRYRRYASAHGLHPGIEPALPIRLQLYNRITGRLVEGRYYEWRPDGGAYDGLPGSLDEAAKRRTERLVCRHCCTTSQPPTHNPTPYSLTDYCFDLRRA